MNNKLNKTTSAIIIIGNEILSGRTQDVNLSHLSIWLNKLGVRVEEVRIIPDIESSNLAFTPDEGKEEFNLRESNLTRHLENDSGDKVTDDGSGAPANRLSRQRDDQIRQAVNLLKSMVIALGAG